MSHRRAVLVILSLAALVALVVFGLPRYQEYQRNRREEAAMEQFRASWSFNSSDPSLLEARLLTVNGNDMTLGFPKIETRDGEQFVDFVSTNATLIDLGAKQIHMASNPDATLADIPLGSMVKVRASADENNPGSFYIYDILVLQ